MTPDEFVDKMADDLLRLRKWLKVIEKVGKRTGDIVLAEFAAKALAGKRLEDYYDENGDQRGLDAEE